MNSNLIIRNIARFILLVLLQVLIFNNIYLGGYINPSIYLLIIAMLPTGIGSIPTLLIAFSAGLCVDVSTNMLGFHTFACTATGFLRDIWLKKIIMRDSDEEIDTPSTYSVPYMQYAVYLFLLLLVFNVIYYTILSFNFKDILSIIISALLSTIVTWIIAIIYQALTLYKSRNEKKQFS
jgi:rod shape-determining protein MreD